MRRTWMRLGLVVFVLLMGMAGAAPSPTKAARARTVLTGVIENCWASESVFERWHQNPNNEVGVWKGMEEHWAAKLGDQYFASRSILKAEQWHAGANGRTQYHNAYDWRMYPGLDPATATGWYELNGAADTLDDLTPDDPGWLVSHASGVGRGSLAGQQVHFTMTFQSWGASSLQLCADPTSVNWHGIVTLEIAYNE